MSFKRWYVYEFERMLAIERVGPLVIDAKDEMLSHLGMTALDTRSDTVLDAITYALGRCLIRKRELTRAQQRQILERIANASTDLISVLNCGNDVVFQVYWRCSGNKGDVSLDSAHQRKSEKLPRLKKIPDLKRIMKVSRRADVIMRALEILNGAAKEHLNSFIVPRHAGGKPSEVKRNQAIRDLALIYDVCAAGASHMSKREYLWKRRNFVTYCLTLLRRRHPNTITWPTGEKYYRLFPPSVRLEKRLRIAQLRKSLIPVDRPEIGTGLPIVLRF